MRSFSVSRAFFRPLLLLASLATYLFSPDDVVWRFIKATRHARLLEHVAFGIAAALLGAALILKIQSSMRSASSAQTAIGNLLQAIGVGCLLPLPGFLLFVFGDACISLFPGEHKPVREEPHGAQTRSWKDASTEHIGLCCGLVSMIVFSFFLIDKVADALFAASALISLLFSYRRALQTRLAAHKVYRR